MTLPHSAIRHNVVLAGGFVPAAATFWWMVEAEHVPTFVAGPLVALVLVVGVHLAAWASRRRA